MREVKIFIVDAFTNQIFGGNRAGVVPNAEHLSSREMQEIAREINASETAFLFKTCDEKAQFGIRYFTPTEEIPFCGHATVAASFVLGTEYNLVHEVERLFLETDIGIVPVDWVVNEGKLESVMMTQINPQVKEINELGDLVEILGLSKDDIDERYPLKCAYTGNWDLMIPIKTKSAVNQAMPNMKRLKEHNIKNQIISTHLYTFDTNDENILLYTRDFSPAVGIDEDPVTGSANGALAGCLMIEGVLEDPNNEFIVEQGNSHNRLGKLFIKTKMVDNKVTIKVGGSAVISIYGLIKI